MVCVCIHAHSVCVCVCVYVYTHTHTHIYMYKEGFPDSSNRKESAYNAGDLSSIPESGRFHGEGTGNPFQHSCRQNSMDRGACWAIQSMGLQKVRHD